MSSPTGKLNQIVCGACGAEVEIAHQADETCPECGEGVDLNGRYRLLSVVGQGAAGVTYRAVDLQSEDVVAVKEMPVRRTRSADVGASMQREARVLRELSHEQLPSYVDHFMAGSGKHLAFYLVQSFIEGPTLADEMATHRYTEAEVLAILEEVSRVLMYLHSLSPPVIHRDLKPGNLIRRQSDGRLVLIDFGAVRDVLKDPRMGGSTVAGTYGFMAPEQFRGVAAPQTDLYALGVLAVVLLSRRDPIDLVLPNHQLDWVPHVHASALTGALIEDLLASEPDARPETAWMVLERIDQIRLGEAPPPPEPEISEVPEAMPVVHQPRRPLRLDRATRRRLGARSKWVAFPLALVGCLFGVHNWYLGRIARAIGGLLFFWTTVPLWLSIYDAVTILFMSRESFDERFNPALTELARGEPGAIAEEIRALHALKEEGVISAEEFEGEKARLLGRRPGLLKVFGQQGLERLVSHADRLFDEIPRRLLEELERPSKRRRDEDQ